MRRTRHGTLQNETVPDQKSPNEEARSHTFPAGGRLAGAGPPELSSPPAAGYVCTRGVPLFLRGAVSFERDKVFKSLQQIEKTGARHRGPCRLFLINDFSYGMYRQTVFFSQFLRRDPISVLRCDTAVSLLQFLPVPGYFSPPLLLCLIGWNVDISSLDISLQLPD